MGAFHAFVHHHREGDGGFIVWAERRGTHDWCGWSAAVQYFDGRHPELDRPIVGVLDHEAVTNRLIERLAAEIDRGLLNHHSSSHCRCGRWNNARPATAIAIRACEEDGGDHDDERRRNHCTEGEQPSGRAAAPGVSRLPFSKR